MNLNPPSSAIFQFNDSIKIKNNDKVFRFKNDVTVTESLVNNTTGIILPVGTTEERPVNPTNGLMRYNKTLHNPEIYYNNAWIMIPTTYTVLFDINPKTLVSTNSTATVTGQDMVPGMIFQFIGSTNISYLVTNYTYVNSSTVTIYRPANMPSNQEPYTLRVTMPNGPMYELIDIVEVGS